MLKMTSIAEIRRRHFVDGESISSLSRDLELSRQTIRKALKKRNVPFINEQINPFLK
jgi:DNA-binding GntR family transcriptional regulator